MDNNTAESIHDPDLLKKLEDPDIYLTHVDNLLPNIPVYSFIKQSEIGKKIKRQITPINSDKFEDTDDINKIRQQNPNCLAVVRISESKRLEMLNKQLLKITNKLGIKEIFDDHRRIQDNLEKCIKKIFTNKIVKYLNQMNSCAYGLSPKTFKPDSPAYQTLIKYSTECFVVGMLFANYVEYLSDSDMLTLGEALILNRVGYINAVSESPELIQRTVELLESQGHSQEIVDFARHHSKLRIQGGKLRDLNVITDFASVVPYYANATVNHKELPINTLATLQNLLKTSNKGAHRFNPEFSSKFVEMVEVGLGLKRRPQS